MEEQTPEVPSGAFPSGQDAAPPSSPSGQKRTRDYGEELKGLTSDEDNQKHSSPPSHKQKRMRHSNADSASESLDDGEIVESSPTRPDPGDDQETRSEHALPGTRSTDPSSAETDRSARSTQQPPIGFNQGISLGVRTSFGKGAATPFPTTQTSAGPLIESGSDLSSPPTSAHGEGAKQGQLPPNASSQSEETRSAQARQIAEKADASPPTFKCGKATWQIPQSKVLDIPDSQDAQNEAFWRHKLLPFIVTLFQANEEPWDRLDVKSLRIALDKYVSKDGGFLRGASKHTKAVRKALQQATADKQGLASIIQRAREIAQSGRSLQLVEHEVSGEEELVQHRVAADEERRQQDKYFPNTEDSSQYCISCSGIGHGANDCPKIACHFCGNDSHNSFSCLTRQRCTKCRQLGHGVGSCAEKLASAAGEQSPCAFCDADHMEDECSEVWRSYDPANATIKKVKAIPAFCYACGGEGHYGPECALPGRASKVTGRTSWSQENRDLYVDPQSDLVAIAWVGLSNFQIRGRATRSAHTHFVSDDDSDDGFIHERIKKPQGRGQIRISSNIVNDSQNGVRTRHGRNDQGRRRQQELEFDPPPPPPQGDVEPPRYNGNPSWQPPLPLGPPPPLSTNGFQGSMVSLPTTRPVNLPPRPGPFTQGGSRGQPPRPQNGRGGRGYRGSRGGRRGGGRGRGQ